MMRCPSIALFSSLVLLVACGGVPEASTEDEAAAGQGPSGEVGESGNGGEEPVGRGGNTGIDLGAGGRGNDAGAAGCSGEDCGGAGTETATCGDGVLDEGEGCDDGNQRAGDGCNGTCRIESGGWICETPGELCVSALVCGDGLAGSDEACDDGNTESGDGCSESCTVEPGWECWEIGEPCVPTEADPECGNGAVEQGESCDDGNAEANDGCSGSCQLESGFLCPEAGEPCIKDEYCGDGHVSQGETCDDGNTRAGDCCSGTCRLEPNCVCLDAEPGAVGQSCSSTVVCGDGSVSGGEACDDGNTAGDDGCTADCTSVESGYTCPASGGPCRIAEEPCGNAELDGAEECDDGNRSPSDGCSAACEIEPGYVCPNAGEPCETILFCGDGVVSFTRGETCDDGGDPPEGDDGCSALCRVEPGFSCTGSPSVCVDTVVCGDKRLAGGESCDDGNTTPLDGCDAECQLEEGWTCAILGVRCQPTCGDGLLRGIEQCDDGNADSGDGCSDLCVIESAADDEADGWVCGVPGELCTRTTCGDGVPEGSEPCDDGDNDMGDGCTPFCRREPSCPPAGGACTTACGDGMLLAIDQENGQECDDGNTVDGDGCSSTCRIEEGYECEDVVVTPDQLRLPIVLRDFRAENRTGGHPDFEAYLGNGDPGIAEALLGSDGKPVHVAENMDLTSNVYEDGELVSEDYFASWYRDHSSYNQTIIDTLTFTRQASGEYVFSDTSFFPLDDRGFGDQGNDHNFHFTSEVRYWFEYQGGETLEFVGDDDVWVYVNKRLAVDLGGVHSAQAGNVVLSNATGVGTVCERDPVGCDEPRTVNLGLDIGSVYEIVVFQAERHTVESNYRLTLSNFSATRSDCGPICGDGVVTGFEQCDLGTELNTGEYGGCNPDCTLAAFCGDDIVDETAGEECDDGVNLTPYGETAGCAPGCVLPPYCGDGTRDTDFGEVCDNGEDNASAAYGVDACLLTCEMAPFCGDGLRNGDEACDDGVDNGTLASACDTNCQPKCGNGVLEAGEQCDEGAENNLGGYGGCSSDCRLGPYCGDGVKNGDEECDDGLNDGSYGTCNPDCRLAPYCGDGETNGDEECDQGADNVADGYGSELCTTRCVPGPFCGDGMVQPEHEECDDGDENSDTVPGACNSTCTDYNDPPITCGNGTINAGEQCDDGPENGTSSSGCDLRCQLKCGNGIKETGEECDDGTNDGSYGSCMPDCTLADWCGDGVKNGHEQCDLGEDNQVDPYGEDTCTMFCRLGPYCGDGRVDDDHGEDCDGSVGCTNSCDWVIPE